MEHLLCSKGWHERCAKSHSHKCKCACKGTNHGVFHKPEILKIGFKIAEIEHNKVVTNLYYKPQTNV